MAMDLSTMMMLAMRTQQPKDSDGDGAPETGTTVMAGDARPGDDTFEKWSRDQDGITWADGDPDN